MTGILETKDLTGGSQIGAVTMPITTTTAMVPIFDQLIFFNILEEGLAGQDCHGVELRMVYAAFVKAAGFEFQTIPLLTANRYLQPNYTGQVF